MTRKPTKQAPSLVSSKGPDDLDQRMMDHAVTVGRRRDETALGLENLETGVRTGKVAPVQQFLAEPQQVLFQMILEGHHCRIDALPLPRLPCRRI